MVCFMKPEASFGTLRSTSNRSRPISNSNYHSHRRMVLHSLFKMWARKHWEEPTHRLDMLGSRRTNGLLHEAGSVFWNTPINIQSFTTDFEFQLSLAQADGSWNSKSVVN